MSEKRHKYPRTPHLSWSPGATNDDRINESFLKTVRYPILVTEKMDGEATTVYSDGYTHARSTTYTPHPTRNHLKQTVSQISYNFPKNFRVCGENLYAKHSIKYNDLTSFFQVYSVWEDDTCLSWDDTTAFCAEHGLETVPEITIIENPKPPVTIHAHWKKYSENLRRQSEGYVLRHMGSFQKEDFPNNVAKYVRKNHVQTEDHWLNQKIVKNGLRKL